LRHFVEKAFVIFDFGYEMFGVIISLLVGVGFLLPGKDKVANGAKLLFFGAVQISDIVWEMAR
jgi:hypothetical protein